MSSDDDVLSEGFAFGGGVKKCLGDELTRTVCLLVARTILESSLIIRRYDKRSRSEALVGLGERRVIAGDCERLETASMSETEKACDGEGFCG